MWKVSPTLAFRKARQLGDLHGVAGFVERRERFEHAGLRQLDFAEHVGCAVLQGLEGADRHAELLALLEVLHRALEAFLGAAEHLGAHADAGDVQGRIEDVRAASFGAQQGVCADGDVLEVDVGRVAAVHHRRARHGDAGGGSVHQQQGDAVALACGAAAAGGDDQLVRNVAVEHELLGAGEAVPVAVAFRAQGDPVGIVAMGFLQGQGQQQFARR